MWFKPEWVLAALALEALLGYPPWLLKRIGHPVIWYGRLIEYLELRWNHTRISEMQRRLLGIVALVTVLVITISLAGVIQWSLEQIEFGWILLTLIATTGLAQRSLYEHVHAVLQPLLMHDVLSARRAVSQIVGRDTSHLDESGVTAAAIESLAESFNDAVVAPVFWLALAGLPGLFAYKAVNTADSLIGHREPRWRAFGWAAARADDVMNWVPARVGGVLIVVAARRGFRVMLRDASKHASPNAGWPEAAMAGALQVKLGGPSTYDGIMHARTTFGSGVHPQIKHLQEALRFYRRSCALLWLIIAALILPNVL